MIDSALVNTKDIKTFSRFPEKGRNFHNQPIDKNIDKLTIKFLFEFFKIIQNVLGKTPHLFSNKLGI